MAKRAEITRFLRHADDGAFVGGSGAGNKERGRVKFFHAL
jgi:hypothetical protein